MKLIQDLCKLGLHLLTGFIAEVKTDMLYTCSILPNTASKQHVGKAPACLALGVMRT